MYFWGLAIETSSAVLLTVAMGLCVDYSAHIAHAFIVNQGKSSNQRMKDALIDMGPAVLNGGFSTFLAFVILMTSESFVFLVFFKVFFLVVFFGLYHGLVFLPIVLSLVGPSPLVSVRPIKNSTEPNNSAQTSCSTLHNTD